MMKVGVRGGYRRLIHLLEQGYGAAEPVKSVCAPRTRGPVKSLFGSLRRRTAGRGHETKLTNVPDRGPPGPVQSNCDAGWPLLRLAELTAVAASCSSGALNSPRSLVETGSRQVGAHLVAGGLSLSCPRPLPPGCAPPPRRISFSAEQAPGPFLVPVSLIRPDPSVRLHLLH